MFLAKLIGTGFYSGYFPKAPGTAGSLLALILLILINPNSQTIVVMIAIAMALGVRTSNQLEMIWGKDSSKIVIDEFVGMWIALLGHDFQNLWVALSAFALFRLFDIWKPLGINQLQSLPEGWGVMADDILAGIYSNLVLWGILLMK